MSVFIQRSYAPSGTEINNRINRMRLDVERQLQRELERASKEAQFLAKQEAERTRREFNRQLDAALAGVNENISRIDEVNRQRIKKLSEEIYTSIGNLSNDIEKVDARVDEVNTRLKKVVQQVNDRFEQQDARISGIEANVQNVYNYLADKRERGRQAAEDARTLAREYFKKYQIRKYLPEEAKDIDTEVSHLSSLPYDEAFGPAQQVIVKLQNAARRAVSLHAAHLAMVEYTDSVLNTVLKMINCNREFTYNDEGEPVTIESDFWSRGRYSELQKEIDALKAEMQTDPDNERLQEICVRSQELDVEAASIRENAIKKAMESEERVILAENLVDAYLKQGYEIKQNPKTYTDEIGYMGGEVDEDWREGVYAIVIGPSGEEITVMVNPEEGKDGNSILFHRNDNTPVTEKEYLESIRRVCEISRKAGYDVGKPQAPENCDSKRMPELGDGTKIKKKGTADKVKAI